MNSEQKQQLPSLTDFWKEPWTASTWGTWSSQNPAAQGLQPSSWMYTRHTANHDNSDSTDFDFGSYSSDCTSFSASSSGIPSPGASPPTLRQRWSSSSSNGLVDYHHHPHHQQQHQQHQQHQQLRHLHGAVRGASSPPSAPTMAPPPGLSPERYRHPPINPTAHSLIAPSRVLSSRTVTSRSSSVESESSALGLYGGSCTGAAATSAFQIAGYRTVELLPTAQQRQTLQKWFGVVRWTHNRAVDALRVDPSSPAAELRAAVAKAEAEHEWAAAVPLAIRDATVAQLVGALHLAQRSAEVAAAATGESVMAEPIGTAAQNKALKYRTRKDRLEQVVLRADGFQFGIPYPEFFGYAPLASSAPIPDRVQTDAILVRSTERFYLCIPDTA